MSHVGSLNCSKEEGLVVVVAEIPLAIHYLFLIKKIIFQHFFISTQNR